MRACEPLVVTLPSTNTGFVCLFFPVHTHSLTLFHSLTHSHSHILTHSHSHTVTLIGINLWDEHIPLRTLVVLGGQDVLSDTWNVARWLREHTHAQVTLLSQVGGGGRWGGCASTGMKRLTHGWLLGRALKRATRLKVSCPNDLLMLCHGVLCRAVLCCVPCCCKQVMFEPSMHHAGFLLSNDWQCAITAAFVRIMQQPQQQPPQQQQHPQGPSPTAASGAKEELSSPLTADATATVKTTTVGGGAATAAGKVGGLEQMGALPAGSATVSPHPCPSSPAVTAAASPPASPPADLRARVYRSPNLKAATCASKQQPQPQPRKQQQGLGGCYMSAAALPDAQQRGGLSDVAGKQQSPTCSPQQQQHYSSKQAVAAAVAQLAPAGADAGGSEAAAAAAGGGDDGSGGAGAGAEAAAAAATASRSSSAAAAACKVAA